jgi:energy-coupling factor transport system permease protein
VTGRRRASALRAARGGEPVTGRRRASALPAARAGAGGLYCVALAAAALSFEHPLPLLAVALAATAAGALAGASRELARAAAFALPLAILVALVNVFVVREGLTVFASLGEVPPFGLVDLTVEAAVYGALLGARVVAVILCCALFTAAVDADEVLRLLRRVSFRSALTAALATRLVPVLARDARRLDDARRCRPTAVPRAAVLRAVTTSALDRAIDVAATLEVRGYGTRPRHAHGRAAEPWSRHDLAFTAAAIAVAGFVVAAKLAGVAEFAAYPRLHVPLGAAEAVLAAALVVVALLPFADRRGIER